MSSWITPIWDRTISDVEFARNNRGNLTPNKGARNYTDLNRISGNLRYLRGVLVGYGYHVPVITSKDDWTVSDVPTEIDIEKFKIDVLNIRNVISLLATTPETPELPYLAFEKINNIEKILFDINYLVETMGRTIDFAWTLSLAHTGIYSGI